MDEMMASVRHYDRMQVVERLKELELRGGSHAMLSAICACVRPMHHGWTERECEELRKDLIRLIGVPEADGGADIRADADRNEEVFVPIVDEAEIAPDGPVLGESITEPMRDWVSCHRDMSTALTTYPAQFPLVGVTDKDVLTRLDAVDREHVWRMQQLRMSMNERNSRTETELDEALEELRRAKDKLQEADFMLGMCIRLPLASDNEPIRVGDVLEDGERPENPWKLERDRALAELERVTGELEELRAALRTLAREAGA